jgi:DNA-directed RNA polymerase I, II, and III subunit RPABC1
MDLTVERALRNLREMLVARGDDVSDWRDPDANEDDPWLEYRTTNKKLETDRTAVFFALTKELMAHKDKKSLMNQLKSTDEFVEAHGAKAFVLVLGEPPAPAVAQVIAERDKELQAHGATLQYFTLLELQFNPARHVLVPRHERLSDADAKAVMAEYQLRSKAQLPVILKTDKMARWLGLKHNDVVRITRHNENSGCYFYYRCCV